MGSKAYVECVQALARAEAAAVQETGQSRHAHALGDEDTEEPPEHMSQGQILERPA